MDKIYSHKDAILFIKKYTYKFYGHYLKNKTDDFIGDCCLRYWIQFKKNKKINLRKLVKWEFGDYYRNNVELSRRGVKKIDFIELSDNILNNYSYVPNYYTELFINLNKIDKKLKDFLIDTYILGKTGIEVSKERGVTNSMATIWKRQAIIAMRKKMGINPNLPIPKTK